MDLDHFASCFSLVLWGLDQKILILVWVTLGLFMGVIAPLFLVDQVASTLGLWSDVDWWWQGLVIGVVVVMEGAQ
jgi:hypothetical protein